MRTKPFYPPLCRFSKVANFIRYGQYAELMINLQENGQKEIRMAVGSNVKPQVAAAGVAAATQAHKKELGDWLLHGDLDKKFKQCFHEVKLSWHACP